MERGEVGCAITLHSTSPFSPLPSPLFYSFSFLATNSSINLTVSSIPNTEESMQR